MATRVGIGSKFEGRRIEAIEAVLRKTGDGLSTPMKMEPVVLGIGEEGYIVYKFRMVDVHHPATNRAKPDEGGVRRVQILDAITATFVDDDLVEKAIRDQEIKNEAWLEQQQGISKIPGADPEHDHIVGLHDTPDPGCSRCEEARLEAEGR